MRRHAIAGLCPLALLVSFDVHAASRVPAIGVRGDMTPMPLSLEGVPNLLYDQTATCTSIGSVSQDFQTDFDVYDAEAADDFLVPPGVEWNIRSVNVGGEYFNGTGPTPAVDVTFYWDASKPAGIMPGCAFTHLTDFSDASGSLAINLPSVCTIRGDQTNPTSFWISVRAVMDFTVGGEWGWRGSSPTAFFYATWRNPANGFGTGCTDWTDLSTCISGGGPDLCFAIQGTSAPLPDDEAIFTDGFQTPSLTETFDTVTAPALPSGWTTTTDAGRAWETVTDITFSAPNAAFADDPNIVSDKALVSPLFILDGPGRFSFHHLLNLEQNFDGAVLEISINGSPDTDIISAGGRFTAGGYADTISTTFSNPIGGRNAWTGHSNGYQYVAGFLPPGTHGQIVRLRWRVASDESVGGAGYWIDDVVVD